MPNFPLFKLAELGSAKARFSRGQYGWDLVPGIKDAINHEFQMINVDFSGWLADFIGIMVFDVLESISKGKPNREIILEAILNEPAFAGKTRQKSEDSTV